MRILLVRMCLLACLGMVASHLVSCADKKASPGKRVSSIDAGPLTDGGPDGGFDGGYGGDADSDSDTDSDTDSDIDTDTETIYDDDPFNDMDGDTISDVREGEYDMDEDGTPNHLDDDSDGDGISDAEEAGDDDLTTPPVDTDGDHKPDFLDLDSDGDGLPDASEVANGTNRLLPDSDGDGVTDLIEVTAHTDPLNPSTNPTVNGDFFFLVPYDKKPDPDRGTLVFEPAINKADVYFLIDSSASMGGWIAQVSATLLDVIVPSVSEDITDVWFGAGEYEQCPNRVNWSLQGPYVGIRHSVGTTDDLEAVRVEIDAMRATTPGWCKEPYGPAVWLFATGDTSVMPADMLHPNHPCPPGRVGYGCIRNDAMPILVLIGDEAYTEGDTCDFHPTPQEVGQALKEMGAKIIVLGNTANGDVKAAPWIEIAEVSGSVNAKGEPLIWVKSAADVGQGISDAIKILVDEVPISLTARARDLENDGVDATVFIDRIEANAQGNIADPRDPTRICAAGLRARDTDGDGHRDTFAKVRPGTPVCFDVIPKKNKTVEPADEPRVFKAAIDVIGDRVTVLDTREVYFLVPPKETAAVLI